MAERNKGQTILWPKETKDRQYYGRKKQRTDNTMAERNKGQTILWPKETKDRQYYGRKKQRTDNTMAERNKGPKDNNEAQSTTQNMFSCTIVPRLLV